MRLSLVYEVFCVAKGGENKMRGSNMREELCRVCARRKKGGLLYFEVNPHHSFATKVT
jgi:hypothetical protein